MYNITYYFYRMATTYIFSYIFFQNVAYVKYCFANLSGSSPAQSETVPVLEGRNRQKKKDRPVQIDKWSV